MFSDAEAYERFMGRWSRQLAPPFLDFAGLPDKGYVLDVGSGTGALSDAILPTRPECRIQGIDPSDGFVAYAKAHSSSPKVSFEVGDAQNLRFRDDTFDASLSLLVFHFIPNPEIALSEVTRVTKAGGVVAAAAWDLTGGMEMLRLFWDAVAEVAPDEAHNSESERRFTRPGELGGLWRANGMGEVNEQPLEIDLTFQSIADYWEPFFLGVGPAGSFARNMSQDFRAMVHDRVRKKLGLASDSTPFTLNARAWAVRGIVLNSV